MKVLLFGQQGQLGRELRRSLQGEAELVSLDRASADFAGDLSRPEAVAASVLAIRPDLVVNAAAWTNVDGAEQDPDKARRINALAPAAMARAAADVGACMVHYSSDYVFGGQGRSPWKESDTAQPLNVYGQSKLEGDILVAAAGPRHLILRTSWLYSGHGSNFARTILEKSRIEASLAVVDDQVGAPTSVELLTRITLQAIAQKLQGIYHVAAAGEVSRHGYACFVLEQALRLGLPLAAQAPTVRRTLTVSDERPARRPLNSRLDTHKVSERLGIKLPPWQDDLTHLIKGMA